MRIAAWPISIAPLDGEGSERLSYLRVRDHFLTKTGNAADEITHLQKSSFTDLRTRSRLLSMMGFQFACIAVSADSNPGRMVSRNPISTGCIESSLSPHAREFHPKDFLTRNSSLSPDAEEFVPKSFLMKSPGSFSSPSASLAGSVSSDESTEEVVALLRIFLVNITLHPDSFEEESASVSKVLEEFFIDGGSVHELREVIDEYAEKVENFRPHADRARNSVKQSYEGAIDELFLRELFSRVHSPWDDSWMSKYEDLNEADTGSGALRKRTRITRGCRRSPFRYSEQRRRRIVIQPLPVPVFTYSTMQSYPIFMTPVFP